MPLISMLKTIRLPNVLGIEVKNCNNKIDRLNINSSNIEFAKKLKKSKG